MRISSPKKPWFTHLSEMATESVVMPPSHDLFSSQRQMGRGGGVGPSFRMERRGVEIATPPWMSLKNRQLHEDAHLPPIARQFQEEARAKTTAATILASTSRHPKRYLLKRAAKTKPWAAAGTTAM